MRSSTYKKVSHHLLAGAGKTDITPPLGTFINGDFVTHFATYIHDPLYAKALVVKDEKTTVAFVVVDICVMPKELVDAIRKEASAQVGIPVENILVSSTHTHAAGSVASVYLSAADLLYTKKLPGLVVQAIVEAQKRLRPAKTAFGSVDVPQHVRCRRYYMQPGYTPQNPVSGGVDEVKTNPIGSGEFIDRPRATTDPQVSFLAVKGEDEGWISVLANYSLHYVGDWENGTISADYFGYFAKTLQEKLGASDDFVGIMSNGTSGDGNIWEFAEPTHYPTGHFQKSSLIGSEIAQKVSVALKEAQWQEDSSIAVQYDEVEVALRKPSPQELEAAKEIVRQSNYENLEIDDAGLRSLYAREQVLLNELPDSLQFPLHAIKMGNGVIGGMGGEIFAETGLWLKAHAGTKYFTIGLANGNQGYVPPAHEFAVGGYETWRSRTSKLATDAEEILRKMQLALIQELLTVPLKH
ncbi:hypothetical protein FSB75_00325 [Flavisolibacter ginsenosidimutans]|uniref:Neutral/alkaline non-lysosomal ceramidase N-terminal domain-containing protein n=2 Tax=Flavisolibacter ginsenosidimutans TaxID=661481 RepID=A0A5B8UP87_9BACT|nr:hypothetical protein FSB75_00325 [Flavisolibacter ginsenosidimutans]